MGLLAESPWPPGLPSGLWCPPDSPGSSPCPTRTVDLHVPAVSHRVAAWLVVVVGGGWCWWCVAGGGAQVVVVVGGGWWRAAGCGAGRRLTARGWWWWWVGGGWRLFAPAARPSTTLELAPPAGAVCPAACGAGTPGAPRPQKF